MTLTVPSYAKINWTLEVLGRRADGYHELRTLLQTVSLADRLTFSRGGRGIELTCDLPGVPLDETNLICRAARIFQEVAGCDNGVQIHLEKRIPLAAGLGGGSSNAAVTLLALQRIWNAKLGVSTLFELASKLGADVPFFLIGGTAIGIGRGSEVYSLEDVSCENILLVNCGLALPTAEVYRSLPPELTRPYVTDMMPFSLEAANRSTFVPPGVGGVMRNDLEMSVLMSHPELCEIKERLRTSGANATLMSGSGSTILALFDSEAARSAAQDNLRDTGWWSALVRTIGRNEYRAAIGLLEDTDFDRT